MLIIFPDLRHYCAKCLSCPVTSNSGRYSFLKSPWLWCAENITLPKLRAALRLSCAWLSQKLLQMFLLELVKLQQQFRSIRSASSISNVTHWKREVIYLNRTYSLNSFKCLVFVLLAVRFCLPLRFCSLLFSARFPYTVLPVIFIHCYSAFFSFFFPSWGCDSSLDCLSWVCQQLTSYLNCNEVSGGQDCATTAGTSASKIYKSFHLSKYKVSLCALP